MKVYMIGIGGSSMAGLCEILLEKDMHVCGSDVGGCPRLTSLGVKVFLGHDVENIPLDTQIVVYSSAISEDNPELKFAREQKMCVFSRGELLGLVSRGYSSCIGVSGSHGKTTTTAMIGEIFAYAGKNASVHFGGEGGRRKCGSGDDIFLCEACEYKDNFLHLSPSLGVCLNIEFDHPDYFKSSGELVSSFCKFARGCDAFLTTKKIKKTLGIPKAITCEVWGNEENSKGEVADFSARNLREEGGFFTFDFYKNNNFVCEIPLRVMGIFNVENALFACGVASLFGCSPFEIQKGISGFFGVSRRLEKICDKNIQVLLDYAHHPTQISAIADIFCGGKNAVRGSESMRRVGNGDGTENTDGKTLVIFQPHTYSRTFALFEDFVASLGRFENLVITSTYPAREEYQFLGSGEFLSSQIENAVFVEFAHMEKYLEKVRENGEFSRVVFLGAGDIDVVGRRFIKTL